ncbi:CXXC motif containing zinc binding protein [Diachasma alloeum]|uniref:CXXC motif containing zinc binding protein n=1 Tax=Diachasma alloeum TaxID=454923 RepID=UPI00073820B7|nr:CXXC motif containing zinc binding protein [Diachasma alloeum]
MVKIALNIKANLDNIEELKPCGPDFRWCVQFTCSNCGEKSDKWNYISLSDQVPAEHGRDVFHFSCKCKLCSRVNTVTILGDSVKSYGVEDLEKFKRIVVFDCRGIEPSNFSAREGWIAKAIDGGKEFRDVDLSEGEWADYCDKIQQPVGIYEIEHNFERIK